MKLCIKCNKRPAEVPDRDNYTGRFVKKVCSVCHQELLKNDLITILEIEKKNRLEGV